MRGRTFRWNRALWLSALLMWVLLALPGCSVVRYLVSGDWNGDADLVVVNQNRAVIGSVALYQEDESRTLCDARGFALLERGESYGLQLEEGEEDCTVALLDMDGGELGRADIRFTGERLYLTLWEDGSVTVSEEEA